MKRDFKKLLDDSYRETTGFGHSPGDPADSKLEYLASNIFNFTTYDSEMAELFARKALDVCAAISDGKTFEYIADGENYKWYLLMCNTEFFAGRLEWGGSIRGAWWDHKQELCSCGLFDGDKQITEPLKFTGDEFKQFVSAMIDLAK